MSDIDWEQQLNAFRRTARVTVAETDNVKVAVRGIAQDKILRQLKAEERERKRQEEEAAAAASVLVYGAAIEQAWTEFKSKDGRTVFFNPVSLQLRVQDLKHSVVLGREQVDPAEIRRLYLKDFKTPKEIINMVWDSHTAVKEENKEEQKGKTSVDQVVVALTHVENSVSNILVHSQHLSSTVIEDLRSIKKKVENIHHELQEGDTTLDTRTDVQFLVDFANPSWNFDNFYVDHYRAQALSIDHEPMLFKKWHLPQYYSSYPLPAGEDRACELSVVLPRKEKVKEDEMPPLCTIAINAETKVCDVLKQVMKEHGIKGNPDDFVLKGVGLNDYLVGDNPVFGYEYIRYQLRNQASISVSIEPKPQETEEPFEEIARYKSQLNPDIVLDKGEEHRGLSCRDFGNWKELEAVGRLPMAEMNVPFRVKIVGLDDCAEAGLPRIDNSITHVFVQSFLFHGTKVLEGTMTETGLTSISASPRWGQWLRAGQLANIPRMSRVAFMLYGKDVEKNDVPLGWCVQQLVDQFGYLVRGPVDLRLWGFSADKKDKHHGKKRTIDHNYLLKQTVRDNNAVSGKPAILRVRFDEFAAPIVSPLTERYRLPNPRVVGSEVDKATLQEPQQKRLEALLEADPLFKLTEDDRKLLWTVRHSLVENPAMLPRFLQCVDWAEKEMMFEAHRLLDMWKKPTNLVTALELLDAKFPDYTIRMYAVQLLHGLSDEDLRMYLLQLTQCLKYEPYHNSPLARFLIERAIRAPFEIGHHFFWHLKAELHDAPHRERFGLLLEEYLSHSGRHCHEMRKQSGAVLKLQKIAEMIVTLKREHGYSDEDAMVEYTKEVNKLNRDFFGPMGKFQIPLNPKLEATTLIVEKCRYMSSKMVPLWLVFKNADPNGDNIVIIFKSGDDLRQDILTLQMLSLMDKIWLENGLDLKMKPYKVLATGVNEHGEGVGMIEVVLNSDTTSGIQLKYGGGAMGALKLDPIDLFLHDHNKGKEKYDAAVDNFICSCAGYCVATFVLGIGDRHNGNIMVTKDGHLFHIDFGHFLGNFKKKFGVNRERAAFVFTPEMAYVMGGKKYKKSVLFKKFLFLCSKAYRALRLNAQILETCFILMCSAGMPELQDEDDIGYMREKLCLEMNEKAADKILQNEIQTSLATTYRRIDNMIHNLKHG